jgi:ketosteroid isomerase-like protein
MYNPLDGVVVEVEGTKLAVGEYVQHLVNATNTEALLVAMLTGDAIFVDAPAVEVSNTKIEMTIRQFLMEFTYYKAVALNPNQNGHTYIKDQILNALTIYADPVGLLGDADSNGVVNALDASLVLQYYTGKIDESELNLAVCELDGNGAVNALDASLILQHYTGKITQFPVEVA